MMNTDFTPRWGKSVFDCKFCGAEGMQWKECAPEKWAPFDLLNDEIHECHGKKAGSLTRDEVLKHLENLGFDAYIPRTISWKFAFIASNETQTLYFLIGKSGIDLKLYDQVRETKLDERGKLFTDGGEFIRNYYFDSAANVHELILELASRHVYNAPLDKSLLSGHGKSWQDRKVDYIRNLPRPVASEAADEMIEIYDAISPGDGEDAYLGDGMWISSDGSLADRGR